jgi:hypothetical protein
MGLDEFTTGSNNASQTHSRSTSNDTTQSDSGENQENTEPYKAVGSGSKQKVFKTESEWMEAKQYMENEMGLNPQRVLNMPPDKRHDVLHRSILGINDMQSAPFHPVRHCIVCDEVFSFPNNWSFTEFRGEPTCSDHEIGEVTQAYNEINRIQG